MLLYYCVCSRYRSINPESGPFRNKLAPLVGPMGLLKCLGFHMAEDGKLKIDDEYVLHVY